MSVRILMASRSVPAQVPVLRNGQALGMLMVTLQKTESADGMLQGRKRRRKASRREVFRMSIDNEIGDLMIHGINDSQPHFRWL